MFKRRQVSVRVGAQPTQAVAKVRPRLVLLGIVPYDAPWLVDALPAAKVTESRYAPHKLGVEHLRFTRGQAVGRLPGLEVQSLLRDAVALALASGCPSVDVLLAHADASPWDYADPAVRDLLVRALGEVPGTVVVLPDAAGPPDTARTELDTLHRNVAAYSDAFAGNFQLGVVDLPRAPEHLLRHALRRLRHRDVCLVSWCGTDDALTAHGWRSGASWMGGRIAGAPNPMSSVAGPSLHLPGGRPVPPGRHAWLGRPARRQDLPDFARDAVAELRVRGQTVAIGNEPTLRDPIGLWDVPLLRTTKVLHHRIVITANLFVFREATEANALLLQNALQMALADFVKRDILAGPNSDQPQIHCVPDKNPGQPALVATIRAFLKPWVREMRLDLAVRPGDAVVLEVA